MNSSTTKTRIVRNLFWGVIAAGLLCGIVWAMRPKPVLVDVVALERGLLQVTIAEDGVTRIKERYVVSTPLAGQLKRIQLEVGDAVVQDMTVLADMMPTDPSLLDPRAQAQAKARVRAAEQRLDVARAELAKATTALEFAEYEQNRANELHRQKAISDREAEAARLAHRAASEDVKAAGFRIGIAEYELELEQAALMLTGPKREGASPGDMLTHLPIKSPISGRVLRIYRESAAVLQAGASILELGDPQDLEVVVDVLSSHAVQVSPGDPVLIDSWGGPQKLNGEVRIVEPAGFTKLSALGVEEQRVNIIVDLTDAADERGKLGDGFRVEAQIVIWQNDDILKIPTSALFRQGDQWNSFVVRDGVARQVAVQIGRNNGYEAEVTDGISQGELVIVHPSDTVSDGVSVEPRAL